MATTYTVTTSFTADTTAVASEVNQNFTDVLTALNALDASNLASGTVAVARISNLTSTQMASTYFLDEDDMASDSATAVASQQSLAAYVTARNLTYDGTEIFNSTAPTTYTDLDIATLASLTAQRMLVHLKVITTTSGGRVFEFRPNGETATTAGGTSEDAGTGGCILAQNEAGYITILTDTSGVVEWLCRTGSTNGTVTLLTWQKVV